MKTCCITWTCERDFSLAMRHLALVPDDWTVVWVVSGVDYEKFKNRVPARVELWRCDFNRGGTLRGNDAIRGMRAVFKVVAQRGFDCIVKLDSDTALFEPRAFSAPIEFCNCDFAYIRRNEEEGSSRLTANGCCYAMSARALARICDNEIFFPNGIPEQFGGHEDLIFSAFLTAYQRDLCFAQINKNSVYMRINRIPAGTAICAHYGYLREEAEALFTAELAAREQRQ